MGKVYWVQCPKCGFDYYVGKEILDIKDFPTLCPKCHHEYPPQASATGIKETA